MMYARYSVVLKSLMDNPQARQELERAMATYPLYVAKSKNEFIPNFIPTREELNNKILNRYKYMEIGFETVGRFLDELETALKEIMPYYNQLLFTMDQDFNIIYNVDYVRTGDTTRDSNDSSNVINKTNATNTASGSDSNTMTSDNTTNVATDTNDKKVSAQTPQSELDVPAEQINTVKYADSVDWNKNVTTSDSVNSATTASTGSTESTSNSESDARTDSNATQKQVEKSIETIKGNFGVVSAQDLILKYRETIINIEQDIINDKRIRDLFMYIY